MGKFYIDRDGSNKIETLYRREQTPGQEALDESHADVVAFINPPAKTKAERIEAITGGSDLHNLVFKSIFKLHNRLQVLEGKPATTASQFLTFLENELS